MVATAQVIATQSHLISLLVHYDGGVAHTVNITNAELAAAAPPGEFRNFLLTDWKLPGTDQATARLRLLGQAAPAVLGGMAADLDAIDHCRCFARESRDNTCLLDVDADVDGATASRVMLVLYAGGVGGLGGDAQLDIEFQHTIVR